MSDPLIDLVRRAALAAEEVVAAAAGALGAPTPCPGMDAGAVAVHLVSGVRGMADLPIGTPLSFGPGSDPDPASVDLRKTFRSAVDDLLARYDVAALDRVYETPFGAMPGRNLVGFVLVELVVHGWDLAQATGAALSTPDDVVAATLASVQMWVDDSVRVPGMFGAEVPVAADAPVLSRLVGFLGRDPAWTPAG